MKMFDLKQPPIENPFASIKNKQKREELCVEHMLSATREEALSKAISFATAWFGVPEEELDGEIVRASVSLYDHQSNLKIVNASVVVFKKEPDNE